MSPPKPPPSRLDPRGAGVRRSLDHAGFFALRTPLLPFDDVEAWGSGLASASAPPEGLEAAVQRDRETLEARLRELVKRADVREALFVASPSLDEAIDAWLADPKSPRARGVVEIVTRYLMRMAARPTPFGLFSGCAVGKIGDATDLVIGEPTDYRRHTRLDMHYLCALTEALEKDPALRQTLRYRPNTGLYAIGDQYRYAEARVDPVSRDRSHHLVSVDRTDYLDRALDRAKSGARAADMAAAIIEGDPTVADEAPGFVDTLIDSQVIVSELTPAVIGENPIDGVVRTLREQPAAGEVAAKLAGVQAALDELDRSGVGASPSLYRAIARDLESLPAKADLARLFQVDLFKAAPDATLGADLVREVERAFGVLHLMTPARDDRMKRFRDAFTARYEEREVRLVEALDEERGVGFDGSNLAAEPSPLLDELAFKSESEAQRFAMGTREAWIQRRHHAALISGQREIELRDEDLEALEVKDRPGPPPDALAAFIVVIAASREAARRGDYRFVFRHASGPSGANLLGRFCLGDAALTAHVAAHLRLEETFRPDAIFAEIAHLSEGRLGNILCRPALRDYEITYLARSGAPIERQITVDDLTISVRGGRIVLRSQRLGREVIPRLTSAHNYAGAELGLYRFLCYIQQQSLHPGAVWSWGALEGSRFLPRVRYGKAIFHAAEWTLVKDDLAKLKGGAKDQMAGAMALRKDHGLPRWIGVADGDNVLPVDLENALSVGTFADLVKNRPAVTLTELFPDELCVEGPAAGAERGPRFLHEIVIPFTRAPIKEEAPRAQRMPAATYAASQGKARSFPPGSEWLYAKIYTGTATVDTLLSDAIAPVVEQAREAGVIDRWFFIRYADPDWHLRVRFHGDPARLAAEVLPMLSQALEPFREGGQIAKIQLDTYEREMERYGGPRGIELAERMFEADSDAVLAIVQNLQGDAGSDARWRLGLLGTQWLFADIGLDLAGRIEVLTPLRAGFALEHHVDVAFDKQLGAKYRKERLALEELLTAPEDPEHPLALGFEALRVRREKLEPIARELIEAEKKGELWLSVKEMAPSYVHMHLNRILRSEQRRQELVVYDFLLRLNESEHVRAKKGAKVKAAST